MLSERQTISTATNVTVCSLPQFVNICKSLNMNDTNVKEQTEYAFIEIGSTKGRCYADNMVSIDGDSSKNVEDIFDSQFFFKEESNNNIRLVYDDNRTIGINKAIPKGKYVFDYENLGAGYTCVKLSAAESKTQKPLVFYYTGGKGFNKALAQKIQAFVKKKLAENPDIKFIVHCMQGRSRSAAVGTYITRVIAELNNRDWHSDMERFYNDHSEPTVAGKPHQFNVGKGRNGKSSKYPHGDTLNLLGKEENWSIDDAGSVKTPISWAHPWIKQYGSQFESVSISESDIRNMVCECIQKIRDYLK